MAECEHVWCLLPADVPTDNARICSKCDCRGTVVPDSELAALRGQGQRESLADLRRMIADSRVHMIRDEPKAAFRMLADVVAILAADVRSET